MKDLESRKENLDRAQFHWEEGNKFALEFFKTLFLFNSSLSAALIAYSTAKSILPQLKYAIAAFLLASLIAAALFGFGYLISLWHGNAECSLTTAAYDKFWKRANQWQSFVYVLLVIEGFAMGLGLYFLFIYF